MVCVCVYGVCGECVVCGVCVPHHPLVMLPYTEGVSEDVEWVCRKVG